MRGPTSRYSTDSSIRENNVSQVTKFRVANDPEIWASISLVIAVKAPALADGPVGQSDDLARNADPTDAEWRPLVVPRGRAVAVGRSGRAIAAAIRRQLIGCVVHAACRRTAPNAVEVAHADKLILGEPAGGSERCERLASLFEAAGIRAERSENVRRAIWRYGAI